MTCSHLLTGADGLSFGGRLEGPEIFRVLRPLGRRRVRRPPVVRVRVGPLRAQSQALLAADAGGLTVLTKNSTLILF